jgi:hypothetical protein
LWAFWLVVKIESTTRKKKHEVGKWLVLLTDSKRASLSLLAQEAVKTS